LTQARIIAQDLRRFMNEHGYTASDLRRGLIPILNGKMGNTATPTLKPVLKAIRAVKPALEQEFCKS
jgi:hypothetical protein